MTDPMIEINRLTEELAAMLEREQKRDGWDRECVICGCKWMEEENTECPRCILTGMVQANQDAGAYDPPGSEEMRAMIDRLTATLVEIRDRAPLDIQEIAERVVGKRRVVAITPSAGCVFFDVNVACEEPGCAVCGTEETSDV